VIKVRIGKPISVNEQNEHTTLENTQNFEKTYILANPFEKRVHFANTHFKIPKSPKTIVTPASQDKMIKEVDALRRMVDFAKQEL
jgi:hypothetical protein